MIIVITKVHNENIKIHYNCTHYELYKNPENPKYYQNDIKNYMK